MEGECKGRECEGVREEKGNVRGRGSVREGRGM